MLLNYPREWVQLYSELRLHCIDPVFKRADQSVLPFSWDAPDFAASVSPTQRRILKEARRFGIEHGYTIPIYSPRAHAHLRASCSLIPEALPIHPYSAFAAQLMTGYLFESAARVHGIPCATAELPALSRRQRECLELAAQGKSDWAIARLMNLRETTVHNYIENAKRRFQVATRVQAVVHALASHQISFGDVIRARTQLPGRRARQD
jgi:LuxR family quorum-sensing system transcriptional regulator CciR